MTNHKIISLISMVFATFMAVPFFFLEDKNVSKSIEQYETEVSSNKKNKSVPYLIFG